MAGCPCLCGRHGRPCQRCWHPGAHFLAPSSRFPSPQVKVQTIKTSVEAATLLLRIDDIVSGLKKRDKLAPGQSSKPQMDDGENVDSEQMLAE